MTIGEGCNENVDSAISRLVFFETGVDHVLVANAHRVDVSERLRHNMKEMSRCDDASVVFF